MADRLVRWGGDGATCTIRIQATQPYNRDTRTRASTYTDYTGIHYSLGKRVLDNADATVAKTDELVISVPASELPAGVLPKTDSKVVLGSVTYRVTGCEPVGPSATSPAYLEISIAP